jgi:hypothetical protein
MPTTENIAANRKAKNDRILLKPLNFLKAPHATIIHPRKRKVI